MQAAANSAEEAKYFVINSAEEKFLYEELIPGAAVRLVRHGKSQNMHFTELVRTCISSLFDLLIVELRQMTPSCHVLIKGIAPLVTYQKPFYFNHYQKELPVPSQFSQQINTSSTNST